MVYLFKTGKRNPARIKPEGTRPVVIKSSDDIIGPIQNIMPDSIEEYRIAIALQRMKIPFTFQYAIDGGSQVRGGQIIDFVVYTAPLPTPIAYNGKYWHSGKKSFEDEIKKARIKRAFSGQINDLVVIWDDIPDVSTAMGILKKLL